MMQFTIYQETSAGMCGTHKIGQICMWNDALLVADGVAPSHFIGSIVLKDEGKDEGLLKIVPSLMVSNRILTLTIFLISTMFVMKEEKLDG